MDIKLHWHHVCSFHLEIDICTEMKSLLAQTDKSSYNTKAKSKYFRNNIVAMKRYFFSNETLQRLRYPSIHASFTGYWIIQRGKLCFKQIYKYMNFLIAVKFQNILRKSDKCDKNLWNDSPNVIVLSFFKFFSINGSKILDGIMFLLVFFSFSLFFDIWLLFVCKKSNFSH